MLKRLFDFFISGFALLILSPVFLLIALVIRMDSKGPVCFRQQRVGRYGCPFLIHKFRTMIIDAEASGMQITVGADPRMTRVGRVLRRYKLDELPQLIDVFVGTMSLVGPRPEVPRYVEYYPEAVRECVLSIRPGITDRASIEFVDENDILAQSTDPHATYVNEVLPIKLRYYQEYVKARTFWGDLMIILDTLRAVLR